MPRTPNKGLLVFGSLGRTHEPTACFPPPAKKCCTLFVLKKQHTYNVNPQEAFSACCAGRESAETFPSRNSATSNKIPGRSGAVHALDDMILYGFLRGHCCDSCALFRKVSFFTLFGLHGLTEPSPYTSYKTVSTAVLVNPITLYRGTSCPTRQRRNVPKAGHGSSANIGGTEYFGSDGNKAQPFRNCSQVVGDKSLGTTELYSLLQKYHRMHTVFLVYICQV